jgi:hypothetical protein
MSDTNINTITEEYNENKPIELESFDDWETAADEDLKKSKKLISDAESTFM